MRRQPVPLTDEAVAILRRGTKTQTPQRTRPNGQAASPATSSQTNGHPEPAPRALGKPKPEPESETTPGVVPWPAPISEEGMFGLAGDFVKLVEKDTEADPNILLLAFLVYAGNLLGRSFYSVTGGDKHCSNLYLSVVGVTSNGRKGSALSVVESFFLRGARAPGLANVIYGISSGEGLIWQIRDPITRQERDKRTGKIEEVTIDSGVDDKRLLVCLGEFYQCLAAMRRKDNSLSSLLRTAWDRDVLHTPVKNCPAKASGAHLSIVACISKDELLRAIDTGDADNGTLNRFLWACSKRARLLPQGGKLFTTIDSPEWLKLQSRFNQNTGNLKGEPIYFSRDGNANDGWGFDDNPNLGVYKQLTEQRTGMWGSVTARSAAQVLRISLLEAALNGCREIRREHQDAALEIWRYCEQSAKYIFGDRLDDPTAQDIMSALRQASTDGLTRNEILDIWHRNKQVADIQRALIWLSQAGLARCDKREGTGGRPSERWFAL
jgi:hypothetical protein